MNRRKALKNIGLTTGFVVATPSIISLLQSCKSGPEKWVPSYFNTDEEVFVNNFVDILLPKTESFCTCHNTWRSRAHSEYKNEKGQNLLFLLQSPFHK